MKSRRQRLFKLRLAGLLFVFGTIFVITVLFLVHNVKLNNYTSARIGQSEAGTACHSTGSADETDRCPSIPDFLLSCWREKTKLHLKRLSRKLDQNITSPLTELGLISWAENCYCKLRYDGHYVYAVADFSLHCSGGNRRHMELRSWEDQYFLFIDSPWTHILYPYPHMMLGVAHSSSAYNFTAAYIPIPEGMGKIYNGYTENWNYSWTNKIPKAIYRGSSKAKGSACESYMHSAHCSSCLPCSSEPSDSLSHKQQAMFKYQHIVDGFGASNDGNIWKLCSVVSKATFGRVAGLKPAVQARRAVRLSPVGAADKNAGSLQVIQPINGDPFIGMLETPVTSSPVVANFLSNLPAYRTGVSPLLRGVEIGLTHGFLLAGPFIKLGPLRNVEGAAEIAGCASSAGLVLILTLCLTLYGQTTFQQKKPVVGVKTLSGRSLSPDPLQSYDGWNNFTAGFAVGGLSGVAWAYICTQILPYYS